MHTTQIKQTSVLVLCTMLLGTIQLAYAPYKHTGPSKEMMLTAKEKNLIIKTVVQCTCATTTVGCCILHACTPSGSPCLFCTASIPCIILGWGCGLGIAGEQLRKMDTNLSS